VVSSMFCSTSRTRHAAFQIVFFRLARLGVLEARRAAGSWQVSSHGRVSTATGRIHFGSLSCAGYRRVYIANHLYHVHRLVAAAFLGPPPDPFCWQVNHLDGDRENNHLTNLQYVTPAENQRHSWATNLRRQTSAAKLSKPILWRPCGQEAWSSCSSQREAGRMLGVWQSSVGKCCDGLMRKAGGNGVWYEFKRATLDAQSSFPAEIWQPARYPGEPEIIPNLMVSNHGRISQAKPGFGNISRGTHLRNGYYAVRRAGNFMLVHRVVAATFLGQPDAPDIQVNHKDSDRGNNHAQNLEYVTASQNSKHSWHSRSEDARKHKLGGQAVHACLTVSSSSAGPWLHFESIMAAARHTGVASGRISRICKGLGCSASWHFRYAEAELIPGEEWRPLVLEGVRRSSG